MKTKKKLIGIIMTLVVLAGLLFSGVAFADDPTTVDVTWDGGGAVVGSVVAGDDATASFGSAGSNHIGEFHATDYNFNHYGYGVDSCTFSLDTTITGGGVAQLTVDRTDSKASYCPAGQQSYTYVWTDDGNATLQNRVGTNYASMKDCNYGWNANDHITVDNATNYALARWVDADSSLANTNSLNFAGLVASGTGNADLDCMSSEAGNGVRLGWGCGCFTNANFTATGGGTMQLTGVGNNSATTAMAPGMAGADSFNFIANWTNSTFTVPDYSTTAK